LPSALATARHIQDLDQVQYPEGVKSPKPELNTNAKDGKFRYDRDFLMQFMSVCKKKPDNLPLLETIGLEPSDQAHSSGSGRRGVSGGMGPPSSTAARQTSVGLGIGSLNSFGKPASGFPTIGNFSAPGKLSSERFMRSTSMGDPPGGPPFTGGRSSPMVRSSSQGGPSAIGAGPLGSKRGEARNDANRISAAQAHASRKPVAADMDAPEVVDRKVRSLLNKHTMEKFESISNQIIQWANKSEKDGRTLIQVIRFVFEKATDEATWSEMYARLCRKMMEQISPDVQDDGIRNSEGKPEDFERGWKQKESTAAAAAEKANEDQALKVESEKEVNKESGKTPQFSEEYYATQKAKRQGLGLVKFIGELFKLQMLTERIMHDCIKKLLSNVNNPEEEEIESLCKLLSTVGQSLDTSKAHGHMNVYFSRMKELAKSSNVSSRMQFMLLDTIELRERKWNTRIAVTAPTTIAQIHEDTAKEKIQQERDSLARSAGMSRGGPRRGHDRDNSQVGPDGWAVAPGTLRPANKAGDLSGFGKIAKSGGPKTFGPSSVFSAKSKDGKPRESSQPPRTSSNMFSMLGAESTAEVSASLQSSCPSRPPRRNASVDLSHGAPVEPTQRPWLNLLPRSKPLAEKEDGSPTPQPEDKEGEEGEIREKAESSISKEHDKTLHCAAGGKSPLVEKFVMLIIESKEADAQLVGDLFERAISRSLCLPASFEEGLILAAELFDDITIVALKEFDLMVNVMKGAKFDEERRTRIANK
ncbi:ARM repeat-containing protein, partial [Phellopilus nigrolimitatus]